MKHNVHIKFRARAWYGSGAAPPPFFDPTLAQSNCIAYRATFDLLCTRLMCSHWKPICLAVAVDTPIRFVQWSGKNESTMECRLCQYPTFHKDMILVGYLEKRIWTFTKMTWIFAKCLGHLLNELDIH